MLHTEVRFLQSNNLFFNLKVIIIWASSTIVQYNIILTKKVQNYFKVMINYIIAVTLHAKRDNVRSFSSYQLPFSQMILLLSWIHIGLTFAHSQPWTQTLCIKQDESDLHFPQFSSCHDVSPQFSYVKAGRQQMWVRWQELCLGCSCSTFDGAEQFFIAELHCLSRKFTLWMLCGHSCKAFDQQCL